MMKKATQKVTILSFLLFLGGATLAQTPVTWSKAYGGNIFDEGHCIKQTADGGYIISGSTDTENNGDVTGYKGGRDIWVVKTDNMGNLEWQSAYGGYILTGSTLSNDGDLAGLNPGGWMELAK